MNRAGIRTRMTSLWVWMRVDMDAEPEYWAPHLAEEIGSL